MTLNEKLTWMRQNIAFPSIDEYEFYPDTDPAVKESLARALNQLLAETLEWAHSAGRTYGEIADRLWPRIGELQRRYSDYGLSDSELYRAVAQFWAINYDPASYDFWRYPKHPNAL